MLKVSPNNTLYSFTGQFFLPSITRDGHSFCERTKMVSFKKNGCFFTERTNFPKIFEKKTIFFKLNEEFFLTNF